MKFPAQTYCFASEQDYQQFIRNIIICAHKDAYNASACRWKDEDYPYIKDLNNRDLTAKDKPQEYWKKCLEVYKKAESEYGEAISEYSEFARANELLWDAGFDVSHLLSEEDDYVCRDLDIDISLAKKNENYPKSFPSICIIDCDGARLSFSWIYPEHFNHPHKPINLDWLEKNVRKFWKPSTLK